MSNARKLADNLPSVGQLSGRNRIINGAMEIAQRSISVTGSTASSILSVDRMHTHASGATYDSTQQSVTLGGETGLPVQFKNYFKFNVTTGANNAAVWTTVEDVTKVQGTYTLSFYAKGVNPAGGNIDITTRQQFGNGGSTALDVLLGNFVLTSTWQRFTFTFTVASVAGKTINAGNYFRVMFHQPNDDNGTAAWNLQLTGWMLEEGSQASPFEHEPTYVTLAKCERYFQTYSKRNWQGTNEHAVNYFMYCDGVFRQKMRAAPTATFVGTVTIDRPQVGVSQRPNEIYGLSTEGFQGWKWPTSGTYGGQLGTHGDTYYRMSVGDAPTNRLDFDAEL